MQPRPHIPGRSLDRWRRDVREFDGVDDFCRGVVTSGSIHTIWYGKTAIDILPEIVPGRPLVVFFSAAVPNREAVMAPVFTGMGVTAGCSASQLFLSDPSLCLSESLGLAWYAGYQGVRLQDDLSRVIAKVACDAGATKVAFVGGSGGGFAALCYSARFPESLAIPWNPQTDIFAYGRAAVDPYIRPAWGTGDYNAAKAAMSGVAAYDVFDLYANGHDNYVLYLQNKTDGHVRGHLCPLLTKMGVSEPRTGFVTERFYLEMGDFGQGHAAPSKEYLNTLFRNLFASAAPWAEQFSTEALVSAMPRLIPE